MLTGSIRAGALTCVVATTLAALMLPAGAASAPAHRARALRLEFARCAARAHSCQPAPRQPMVLGGHGFNHDVIAVFTIRQHGYLMNESGPTRYVSATRLRVRVPPSAVSGPIYVLSATDTSNPLEIAVRGRPGVCPSTPAPGNAVTRWRPVVVCVLGLLHQPQTSDYVGDVFTIIDHESSGDPASINRWDSNAQNGDPSRGLMQVIGATFNQYRDRSLPDNIYDPAANIYAGLAYGIARYGSIPNIPGVKSVNSGGPYVPYKRSAPPG